MELTYDEIVKYLEIICSGFKIVDIDSKPLVISHPGNKTKMYSRFIYDQEYNKSIQEGLLSNDRMREMIEKHKFITTEESKRCDKLKSEIASQKVLLSKTTKVKSNQERIRNLIEEKTRELNAIEYKINSKMAMTAESRAEESRLLYMCWCCVEDFLSNQLYWQRYEDFLKERDIQFRQKVFSEFITHYYGLPTSIIRFISRSNLWRVRYVASMKTSEMLFGVPTSDYTTDQLNLVYWSQYYQSIYEMMPEDRPQDDVIEDDNALDAFMQSYYDEMTKEAASRRHRKKLGKSKVGSAFDKEEVIVTRTNELFDDIEFDEPVEAKRARNKQVKILNKKSRRGR